MATRKRMSQDILADHLSRQIESLQDAFRKLSKAATLKDLGSQFVDVVQRMFPAAIIDILYRPADSTQWQTVINGGAKGTEELLALPRKKASSSCSLHETSKSICIVQRLVDKSTIGMVLARKSSTII
ncbi:MAG: hypothetical protein AABZ02_07100 [Bacteroidota bacterium]